MLRPARQGVMLRHRRLLFNRGNDTTARSPRKEIRPTRSRGLAAPGSGVPRLEARGGLLLGQPEPTASCRVAGVTGFTVQENFLRAAQGTSPAAPCSAPLRS